MIKCHGFGRKTKKLRHRYGLINFSLKQLLTFKIFKIPLHFLQEPSPLHLYFWSYLHSPSALSIPGYLTILEIVNISLALPLILPL